MPSTEEVLMQVRAAGANDRFHVTGPVDERLRARGASMADVRHALAFARVCMQGDDGTYRVGGVDLDGGPLSLIVSIANGAVVVISEADR